MRQSNCINEMKIQIKTNKNGFLLVEAAIFLPVFIIGILTIALLMKFVYVQESIFHDFQDEARRIAMEAYLTPVPIPLRDFGDQRPVNDLHIDSFRYLYQDSHTNSLIRIRISYHYPIVLPIKFIDEIRNTETLLFRGWTGRTLKADPMTIQEMERPEPSSIVYIFPKEGGRYHSKNCSFVTVYPFETLLTQKIRDRYTPCELCDADQLQTGDLVYCFLRSGTAYHRSNCPTVLKYYSAIEREQAIELGYTPCTKCGGGQ